MKNSLTGIISDSHDNRNNIRKAVDIFNQKEIITDSFKTKSRKQSKRTWKSTVWPELKYQFN